jgi:hypothetical protein
MVLKGDEQIVFIENLDPIQADKTPWFSHDALKPLGVDLTKPWDEMPVTEHPTSSDGDISVATDGANLD